MHTNVRSLRHLVDPRPIEPAWQITAILKLMAENDSNGQCLEKLHDRDVHTTSTHFWRELLKHTQCRQPLPSMRKIGQPSFSSDINLWGSNTHQRAIRYRTSLGWNKKSNWIEDEYRQGGMGVKGIDVSWIWFSTRKCFKEMNWSVQKETQK